MYPVINIKFNAKDGIEAGARGIQVSLAFSKKH